MDKTAIILQARMSSKRLPGKTLAPIGTKPLVWYVITRLQATGIPVVVSTSEDPSDDVLADYLKSHSIDFFRGSLDNVLQRYIQTAEEFGIRHIIRVTGDNPLVDTESLQKQLPLFEQFSYADGIYYGGFIPGTGYELVRLEELKKIPKPGPLHREHVTLALREAKPSRQDFCSIAAPPGHALFQSLRLTCDHKKDLALLRRIYSYFDFRTNIRIPEIFKLMGTAPEIFSGERRNQKPKR